MLHPKSPPFVPANDRMCKNASIPDQGAIPTLCRSVTLSATSRSATRMTSLGIIRLIRQVLA